MKDDVIILGIETSCDETAAAVVANGRVVLSNVIYSQVEEHRRFGGVVPEIASRKHIEHIDGVVSAALKQAGVVLSDLSAVAVTCGPGLVGALLVGLSFAKALAFAADIPIVGLNHIEGHICANYLETGLEPPFISLVASGGHTHLVAVSDYGVYEVLGKTRDDAAGEAFDKVSRALGLGYPGGVLIDALAKRGDSRAIDFPRALLANGFDFSFSGLKSAVLNYLNGRAMSGTPVIKEDVAASFQAAVVDVLALKAEAACLRRGAKKFALAGGVSSNSALRARIMEMGGRIGAEIYIPPPVYCTDNAAMIAGGAYFPFSRGVRHGLGLNAYPSLKISEEFD